MKAHRKRKSADWKTIGGFGKDCPQIHAMPVIKSRQWILTPARQTCDNCGERKEKKSYEKVKSTVQKAHNQITTPVTVQPSAGKKILRLRGRHKVTESKGYTTRNWEIEGSGDLRDYHSIPQQVKRRHKLALRKRERGKTA